MRHIKMFVTLLLFMTLLLPLCVGINSASSASALSENRYVRVGLAVPENNSTMEIASMSCRDGFLFGSSNSESFRTEFEIDSQALAIFPDKNFRLNISENRATGYTSVNGNIGAFHISTGEIFSDYSSACRAAAGIEDGFVAFDGSKFQVRKGNYFSKEEAAAFGNPTEPSEGGLMIADIRTGKLLLEYIGTQTLAFKGKNDVDVVMYCNSDIAKPYPGFFEITAVPNIRIINILELELYVKCVMANEIGTNQTRETRRAFSVLVRTVPQESKHGSHGYDVCASSCCQAYMGNYRRDAENDLIVDSTRGEYVTYNGKPIFCLYHNSNGGASCSSVAAWGGEEIPYLVSVSLPEDEKNPSAAWQKVFTKAEFNEYIHSRTAFSELTGSVDQMTIMSTDPYGSDYVTLLAVRDNSGNTVYLENAMPIRSALGIQSGNFSLSYTMTVPVIKADGSVSEAQTNGFLDANGVYHAFDSFAQSFTASDSNAIFEVDLLTMNGLGTGHGVGFSSNGSEQLASQGYSYRYILSFYYPGTAISKLY